MLNSSIFIIHSNFRHLKSFAFENVHSVLVGLQHKYNILDGQSRFEIPDISVMKIEVEQKKEVEPEPRKKPEAFDLRLDTKESMID